MSYSIPSRNHFTSVTSLEFPFFSTRTMPLSASDATTRWVQPGEARLLRDELLDVGPSVDLEDADHLPLVGLQGPHHHGARLLPRRLGARRIVVLHLGEDEEVDYADHAGEDGAEEEQGGEGDDEWDSSGEPLCDDLVEDVRWRGLRSEGQREEIERDGEPEDRCQQQYEQDLELIQLGLSRSYFVAFPFVLSIGSV
jgi:hypothetical protein